MLRELKFFRQVCRDSSVRKAAKNLYITPQGLSKSLKSLENALGVNLFLRTPNGMAPTDYGRLVEKAAGNILDEFERLESEIRRMRADICGSLEIPCAFGVISALSTQFAAAYRERYPNVSLELADYPDLQAEKLLLEGRAEICLTIGPVDESFFTGVKLSSNRMRLIVHREHRLAGRDEVSFSELKGERWVFVNEQFKNHHSIIENCALHGFYPEIAMNVAEISLVHKYTRLHGLVGVTVDYVLGDLRHEDVVSVGIADDSWHGWDVYMITRKGAALSLPAESFWAHMRNFCGTA